MGAGRSKNAVLNQGPLYPFFNSGFNFGPDFENLALNSLTGPLGIANLGSITSSTNGLNALSLIQNQNQFCGFGMGMNQMSSFNGSNGCGGLPNFNGNFNGCFLQNCSNVQINKIPVPVPVQIPVPQPYAVPVEGLK